MATEKNKNVNKITKSYFLNLIKNYKANIQTNVKMVNEYYAIAITDLNAKIN